MLYNGYRKEGELVMKQVIRDISIYSKKKWITGCKNRV